MPKKGYKQTEDHKRKCGDLRKGKKLFDDHKKKISLALIGKKLSKDHIQKLTIARRKRPLLSKETKRKIGESIKELWDDVDSVFHSEEFKMNRSEANKGENNPCYGKYKERNPHWKGGSNEYWHEKAWEIFGNNCCENCYMTNEEHLLEWNERLHMHNTIEIKDYKIMESEAWMTLCRTCHSGLEAALENEKKYIKLK